MPEQLNKALGIPDTDGESEISAASKETEAKSLFEEADKTKAKEKSQIEEFIREEQEKFNTRYAEIKGLVNTVRGLDTAISSQQTEDGVTEPIVLSILTDRKSGKEDIHKPPVEKTPTVSVNPTRYTDVDITLPKIPREAIDRKFDYGEVYGESVRSGSDDFYGEKLYSSSDYTAEYADPEFDMRGDGVLNSEPSSYVPNAAVADLEKEQHAFDEYHRGYRYEAIDIFAKSELSKRINGFYREQSALLRRISKLESRQKNADIEENISLIVEKISVAKELCELAVEILASCVYLETKGKSARFKRVLKSDIDRYNAFCDEYESASGRPLERLDYVMIDDIMDGKICRPIPTVYYYGNEDDAVYDRHDEDYDRIRRIEEEEETLDREYKRYLDGEMPPHLSDAERKALAKRKSEKLSAIKRATERDVLLVGLRSEYALSVLEAKRDILVRSYGLDKRKMLSSIKTIDKKIEKIKKKTGRAVKLERENNSRYYLLPALDAETEKLKSGARRERLDALRSRLDVLLAEREGVNDRLIALYGGSDNGLKKTKISRKAANVRRKSATLTYKRQRKIAKKIDKYRVPMYMKERAYELLNQKTQAVATAEECHYKLRRLKPIGRARRELVLEIRRAKASIRRLDKDIRYMLKKLKRNQERYEDNKEWAAVIAFVLFISLLGIAAWFIIGDEAILYFKKLAEQLGGG